jgi:hypothetical protein
MSNRVLPLVDLESLVTRWLKSEFARLSIYGPNTARTELPNPVDPGLPLVQVIQSTGSADSETTSFDRVDLYNMAATRAAMWALTKESHAAMGRLGGAAVDGQLIDVVRVVQRPSFLAWSPTVPRSIGVYELQFRPRVTWGG